MKFFSFHKTLYGGLACFLAFPFSSSFADSPTVDSATAINDTTIEVIFSEGVENLDHSKFSSGDFTVSSGGIDGGDNRKVVLTVSSLGDTAFTSSDLDIASNAVTDIGGANANADITDFGVADGQLPTATVSIDDTLLIAGETATLTITFSEVPTDFVEADDITVENGTLSSGAFDGSGLIYTASFTPTVDHESTGNTITLGTAWTDSAGNIPSSSSVSSSYDIDTLAPSLVSVVIDSDPINTVDLVQSLVITYSEGMDPSVLPSITLNSSSNFSVGAGTWSAGDTVYTVDLTHDATAEEILAESITVQGGEDVAGNTESTGLTSDPFIIDTLAPTATVSIDDTLLIAGETATLTVTFSEVPTAFVEADDITVENGTLSSGAFDGSGLIYTASFTPTVDHESTGNTITLGTAWTDPNGNPPVSSFVSSSYDIDTLTPTATSVSISSTNTNPALAKAGEVISLDFTLSEALTADPLVTIAGQTATVDNSSAPTYTAEYTVVSSDPQGSTAFTLDFTDIAGNAGTQVIASTDGSDTIIDTIAPLQPAAPADLQTGSDTGDSDSDNLTNETAPTFNAVCRESGSALTLYEGSTVLNTHTCTGVGPATLTASALGNGSHNVFYTETDEAGNESISSSTLQFNIDIVSPTASLILSDTELRAGETATLTITLSESTTDLDASDITVQNGTLSGFSGSGSSYTALFTPTADHESIGNTITLGTAWTDSAGNIPSADTLSPTYVIDTLAPTVSLTDDKTETLNILDNQVVFTFLFSEDVSGFETGDITVAGGTKGVFTTISPQEYTLVITADSNSVADITLDIPAHVYSDTAGNTNTAVGSGSQAVDTLAPSLVSVAIDSDPINTVDLVQSLVITYSERMDPLVLPSITLNSSSNFSVGAGTWSVGDTVYTVDLTHDATAEEILAESITVQGGEDVAGNTESTGLTSDPFIIDTLAPTATVSIDDTLLIAGETATLTVTFSEVPTAFVEADDITVENGTLSSGAFDGSGLIYTASFTPTVDHESTGNTITLGTAWTDPNGNPPVSSFVSSSYDIDTLIPVLTQTTPVVSPLSDSTPEYVFNTTQSGSVTYSGACSSALTNAVSGDNTLDFNALPDGEYTDCQITVTDFSGNISSPLSVNAFIVDTTAPLLSINGSQNIVLVEGNNYSDQGASCTDATTSCTVTLSGSVNTSILGDYTITYTATDSAGNSTSLARTVKIVPVPKIVNGSSGGGGGRSITVLELNKGVQTVSSSSSSGGGTKTPLIVAQPEEAETEEKLTEEEEISLEAKGYTTCEEGQEPVRYTDTDDVYILDLTDRCIVNGSNSEGEIFFYPENTLNRAEAVKMLVRSFGNSYSDDVSQSPFADVSVQDWFAPYVVASQNNGWVKGYGDGSFQPQNQLSRVEGLAIVARASGVDVSGYNQKPSYTDVPEGQWFTSYILWAEDNDLLKSSDGKFSPSAPLTRKEFAKIISLSLQ